MASSRASSVLVGSKSHYANYERGGMSVVGNIFPTILPNEIDGTIDLGKIEESLPVVTDPHIVPVLGLSLESSHNLCSGRVLKTEYISKVKKIAKKKKITLHLDGARCWNAALYLGVDIKTYT